MYLINIIRKKFNNVCVYVILILYNSDSVYLLIIAASIIIKSI